MKITTQWICEDCQTELKENKIGFAYCPKCGEEYWVMSNEFYGMIARKCVEMYGEFNNENFNKMIIELIRRDELEK